MSNSFFRFKQFVVQQDRCAMKVTTDSCLFGAWAANDMRQNKSKGSVLDIGTGTGLLSLMIASQTKELKIDAIEIEGNAAMQAKENIDGSPWKDRINILHADIRNFAPAKPYDFIISNPPFYENELRSGSGQKNTAHHSSDLSLDTLLRVTRTCLAGKGIFYLLLPYKRNKEAVRLFRANELYISEKLFIRQSVHHDYFRMLIKGSTGKTGESKENEISIWNDKQQYTEEFIELLRDYYLYL